MDPAKLNPWASATEESSEVSRRDFIRVVTMAAAAVGLSSSAAMRVVEAAEAGLKPSVIWLHFQECTGCTESLLRTSHPSIAKLIIDLISLDYHETLFAAAGHGTGEDESPQAEPSALLQDVTQTDHVRALVLGIVLSGEIVVRGEMHHGIHWSGVTNLLEGRRQRRATPATR